MNDLIQDQLGRVFQVDPFDLGARGHDGVNEAVIEAEHTFDHVLLGFFKDAYLSAFFYQAFDLFFGDGWFVAFLYAQQAQTEIGGSREEMDDG